MDDAGYREALHALMTLTGSFIVPISDRLVMVVKDTEAKRKEVENTVAYTVPIPEPVSLQEAQELGRTVQQVMEIQRFAIDSAQRLAIFRDRVSKAVPAQMLFQQLLSARPQVMIEVELLSAGKSLTTQLGLNLQASFPLAALRKTLTLGNMAWPEFAIGITGARLVARADRSEVRTLYRAQIRAVDSQAASLHVGEKYPIMTLAYIGDTSGSGEVFTPPPSFNFEDLGLVLKLTPKVHDQTEATFDIEAEFKLLGAGSLNGIPVISNRKFTTRVRLRFDEAAIISGLVTRNDLLTLSGPAGLINIPVIGGLLGQTDRVRDDVQVLLAIRPRLLTAPPTDALTRPIWTGSETRTRIPM
jgi:type II secretory pathway component GspD/PulD (secretin)